MDPVLGKAGQFLDDALRRRQRRIVAQIGQVLGNVFPGILRRSVAILLGRLGQITPPVEQISAPPAYVQQVRKQVDEPSLTPQLGAEDMICLHHSKAIREF